jgi:GntR family transcriptional regulator
MPRTTRPVAVAASRDGELQLPLDSNNPTPVYMQIRRGLLERIDAGDLPEGTALPSERDLADSLGVSRMTVRQALVGLESDGLLIRRHGSGTYVAPRRIVQSLSALTSFSEDMRSRGLVPGGRVLSFEHGRPSPEEALSLGLGPSASVARLRRLRTADGTPLALETSSLPEHVAGDLRLEDVQNRSLYDVLRARGFTPYRAIQHLRAAPADAPTARLLEVPEGASVLSILRVTWDAGGVPIEFVRSQYRGDRYDFVVELQPSS